MNGVMKQFVECCFFQKVTRLLSRHVLRVCQGPLATSKAITAKNVTFKKSLRFSNFFYRDYFNSLKTSNICKFSGIDFLGPNPKLRRRKKNLSWDGYVLLNTSCQGIHVTKCATSRANFFFCQSLVAVAVVVEKAP